MKIADAGLREMLAKENTVPTEGHVACNPTSMTLLDYFAGQAMAGMLANAGFSKDFPCDGDLAQDAYEKADAMIAEKRRREAEGV